jgi:hypothetical protein
MCLAVMMKLYMLTRSIPLRPIVAYILKEQESRLTVGQGKSLTTALIAWPF